MDGRKFEGVITALITPFEKGSIDWKSLDRLLDYQLDQGVDGFVVNGTTGESPCLLEDEVKQLVAWARKRLQSSGEKKHLIVGTGSNSTAKTVNMTKLAEDWGADAALVVTPYYNKPPQRGLTEHLRKVADSTNLPLLLYNVPGRTITDLSFATIESLSAVKNIVGIKEASGNLKFGRQLLEALPEDFLITSGDDGTCMDLALAGGGGVISVCSHILGKEMKSLFSRAKEGDTTISEEFASYQEFINGLYFESNPIPVKMALYLLGMINSPELRLPLTALSEKLTVQLKVLMTKQGLI